VAERVDSTVCVEQLPFLDPVERQIREYSMLDFSNWKDHDSYQNAFDRLLRDLTNLI
jgi:hypothetical protein